MITYALNGHRRRRLEARVPTVRLPINPQHYPACLQWFRQKCPPVESNRFNLYSSMMSAASIFMQMMFVYVYSVSKWSHLLARMFTCHKFLHAFNAYRDVEQWHVCQEHCSPTPFCCRLCNWNVIWCSRRIMAVYKITGLLSMTCKMFNNFRGWLNHSLEMYVTWWDGGWLV